jgi:CheY-like chemotaxis protein
VAQAKILLAEDENIVALDIKSRLISLGYAVLAVVSSGEDAIRKAAETRPDLVLMDIKLKGEMDGIEAAAQIKARFDIPVIYLTAYVDKDTMERARQTDPLGYVTKPYEEEDLTRTIEMALTHHRKTGDKP